MFSYYMFLRMMEHLDDSDSDMDYESTGSDTDLEDFIVYHSEDSSGSDDSYRPGNENVNIADPQVEDNDSVGSGPVTPSPPASPVNLISSDSEDGNLNIDSQDDDDDRSLSPIQNTPPLRELYIPIVDLIRDPPPIADANELEIVEIPNDPNVNNPEVEEMAMPIEIGAQQDVYSDTTELVPGSSVQLNSNTIGNAASTSTTNEWNKNAMNYSCDDDGQMCPICFEPWTNSGDHRLVSLKCGHLFGQECIEKWIKGSAGKAKCPQCNSIAKKADIRRIFAKSLKVLDTSERDRALESLSKEQELRRKIEMEKLQMSLRYQMSSMEVEKLKKELIDHKTTIEQLRTSNRKGLRDQITAKAIQRKELFLLEKLTELNKDGGCRVMSVSAYLPLIVTSQPSKLQMFAGFGIRKVSTMDFRSLEFVYLHQKDIKDTAFHIHDSLVLTASLDKTAKITNVYSNSIVQTYNLPMEAWSCVWDKENGNNFYLGLKNGSILVYDTRKPSTEMTTLRPSVPMSPVVALEHVQKQNSVPLSMNGVLALQLSGCSLYENLGGEDFKCHPLAVEGKFTSLSMEPSTGHVLISSRPSAKQRNVNHILCELNYSNLSDDLHVVDKSCSLNILQTIEGGQMQAQITRSKLMLNPRNESSALVCAGDEAAQAALLWDINNGKCVDKLKADSPVLDLCSFRYNADFCISTLTKDSLRVYKMKDN